MKRLVCFLVLLFAACDSANDCPLAIPGDVNLDGKIEVVDAALIYNNVHKFQKLKGCAKHAADYDGDGRITDADADAVFAVWLGGKRSITLHQWLEAECAAGTRLPWLFCP